MPPRPSRWTSDDYGYVPVDPYRPSAAIGAQNVLGRAEEEPTLDEIRVPKPKPLAYPSYYPIGSPAGGYYPPPAGAQYNPFVGAPRPDPWGPIPPPKRTSLDHASTPPQAPLPEDEHTELQEKPQEPKREERPQTEDAQPELATVAQPPEVTPAAPLPWLALALGIILDQIPRQIYLYLLLRLPALYWSRVTRIFQDANMSMSDIKEMALELAQNGDSERTLMEEGILPYMASRSSSFSNLRNSWHHFISSLLAEWTTLNIISVLLLSAILTILQIETAVAIPLARYSALLSLVCAFMSLLYGCIYIIRFGTMKRTHKAAEWAHESQRTRTSIFWNVWVMLALPAIWLGWSLIFFIVCIMSIVWQTGTTDPEPPFLASKDILAPRVVVSAVLALGLVYLSLITGTLRRYGDLMDQAWKERVKGWAGELYQRDSKNGYGGYPFPYATNVLEPPLEWGTDIAGYPGGFKKDNSTALPTAQNLTPSELRDGMPEPSVPFVSNAVEEAELADTASAYKHQAIGRWAAYPVPLGAEISGYTGFLSLPIALLDNETFEKPGNLEASVRSWLNGVREADTETPGEDLVSPPGTPMPEDTTTEGPVGKKTEVTKEEADAIVQQGFVGLRKPRSWTGEVLLTADRIPLLSTAGVKELGRVGKLVKLFDLTCADGDEPDIVLSIPAVLKSAFMTEERWDAILKELRGAWRKCRLADHVPVEHKSDKLWWTPTTHKGLTKIAEMVERWNDLIMANSPCVIMLLGTVEKQPAPSDLGKGERSSSEHRMLFSLYMGSRTADPLVLTMEKGEFDEPFQAPIRFSCGDFSVGQPHGPFSMQPYPVQDIYVEYLTRVDEVEEHT
ncbi:hypothetical protein DFP72DRAFT_1053949 [Ephemerocybe angulata]|uniref:Uncharacterized protein n=1 Tax=Ephemerocybe angulata TaxID=980116 RepID=A0A8H6H8L2_9AGAR|nr:hypothetical protein DFP72DRAFT_1053949 [Tulosesus angulatus]